MSLKQAAAVRGARPGSSSSNAHSPSTRQHGIAVKRLMTDNAWS
jgi:hypothetical protein